MTYVLENVISEIDFVEKVLKHEFKTIYDAFHKDKTKNHKKLCVRYLDSIIIDDVIFNGDNILLKKLNYKDYEFNTCHIDNVQDDNEYVLFRVRVFYSFLKTHKDIFTLDTIDEIRKELEELIEFNKL